MKSSFLKNAIKNLYLLILIPKLKGLKLKLNVKLSGINQL